MKNPSTVALVSVSAVLAVAIIAIGLRFLVSPETSALGYGVPVTADGEASAYLAVKGLRDLTSGLIGLALLATGQLRAAGWVLVLTSVIPFGDAAIVLAHGGSKVLAYGMHGGVGGALLVIGTLLILDQRRDAPHPAPRPVAARR